MLRRTNELRATRLQATDGDIGRCKDLLFDDRHWTVRYVVADTGTWISGRWVLISPISVRGLNDDAKRVEVALTREEISHAPSLDEDAPVSRQHEMAFNRHYGYPFYWVGTGVWGPAAAPALLRDPALADGSPSADPVGDPTLRSVDEVAGYTLSADDGDIGHVEDFVLDDETWTLRYMVVDTRNWLPGRKVLVSPAWVRGLDWAARSATVELTKAQIKESPEYRDDAPIDRDYEARLHETYRHPPYWEARGV